MAQLVERTLGKGEVPSSTLGISTIEKNEALQIAAGLFVFLDHKFKHIQKAEYATFCM